MTTEGPWKPELDELAQRREWAEGLGGEEAVAKHTTGGRLTIRGRIEGLADADSFREVGKLTGTAQYAEGKVKTVLPAPYVMGLAKIRGRPGGDRRRGFHRPRRHQLGQRSQEGRPGGVHRGPRRDLPHPAGEPDRRLRRQRRLDQAARSRGVSPACTASRSPSS
jgi:hypothetical protein